MPSLELSLVNEVKKKSKEKYTAFVETGTYKGRTIFRMEPLFQELHTIEINKVCYERVTNQYKGKKIHFYLGDSSTQLPEIVKKIKRNTIFFLDAHWSGGKTMGRGDKDCPLIEEVSTIHNHFKYHAILILDDVRLFEDSPTKEYKWKNITIQKIVNLVKSRLLSYSFSGTRKYEKDRMILFLKNKE